MLGSSLLTDVNDFIHAPFRSGMDIFSVFLAVGLVLILIFLWSRILAHLGVD